MLPQLMFFSQLILQSRFLLNRETLEEGTILQPHLLCCKIDCGLFVSVISKEIEGVSKLCFNIFSCFKYLKLLNTVALRNGSQPHG